MSVMKILAVTLLVCAMVVLNEAEPQTHLLKRSRNCPTGWHYRGSAGHCYHLVKATKTWHAAEKHCETLGAHLASVHTKDVSTYLKWLIDPGNENDQASAWLGASHTPKPGVWKWTDGTLVDYAPNRFKEGSAFGDCLRVTLTPKPVWDAIRCSNTLPSVCAIKV